MTPRSEHPTRAECGPDRVIIGTKLQEQLDVTGTSYLVMMKSTIRPIITLSEFPSSKKLAVSLVMCDYFILLLYNTVALFCFYRNKSIKLNEIITQPRNNFIILLGVTLFGGQSKCGILIALDWYLWPGRYCTTCILHVF
jgi:hypothetical protein